MRWSPWFALFALLAWAWWPVTAGDFVIDDYVFLAVSRMVSHPLTAFWQSHFYEPYYFRPLGVISWWLAQRGFGLDYASHSLINLVLHGLNVALLAGLLGRLGVVGLPRLAAASLFALAPFSLGAALWPSNRFDLLAVAALLALAIQLHRVLTRADGGVRVRSLALLALLTLTGCWSKELAYPVAGALGGVALFSRAAGAERGVGVRACGVVWLTVLAAFLWRHALLGDAYAGVVSDPLTAIRLGVLALARGGSPLAGGAWLTALAGVALLALLSRRQGATSVRALLAAVCVFAVALLVQTPLAHLFVSMLDGSPLGAVTFARFYYAPWAALCVALALLLARARWSTVCSIVVLASAGSAASSMHRLAGDFAMWSVREVRPLALAATAAAEQVAAGDPGCAVVLLGTEARSPYFRMFADVTVKARTTLPDAVWRCHVMAESTPWIFVFPEAAGLPAPLPLRQITNPDGGYKLDAVWDGVRFRYRLPPTGVSALPVARFFEWRPTGFVDATVEVRSGARPVVFHDW